MTRKDPNAQQKEESTFIEEFAERASVNLGQDVIDETLSKATSRPLARLASKGLVGASVAAVLEEAQSYQAGLEAGKIRDKILGENNEESFSLWSWGVGAVEGGVLEYAGSLLTPGGLIAKVGMAAALAGSSIIRDKLSEGGPAAVVESYASQNWRGETRYTKAPQEEETRMERQIPYITPEDGVETSNSTPRVSREGTWRFRSEDKDPMIAEDREGEGRTIHYELVDKDGKGTGLWATVTIYTDKNGNETATDVKIREASDSNGNGIPDDEELEQEDPQNEPRDPEDEDPQEDDAEPDPEQERPNPANEDQGDADSNADNPLKDIDADIDWDPDNDGNSDPVTGYEGLEGWNGRIDPRPLDELNGGDGDTRFDYLIDFDGTIDDGPNGRPNQDRDQEVNYGWLEEIEPRTIGDTIQSPMADGNLSIAGINLNLDDQELNLAAVTGDI